MPAKSQTISRGVEDIEEIVEAVVEAEAVVAADPQMNRLRRPRYKCNCKVKQLHSRLKEQRIKQRAPWPKNKLKEKELKRKGNKKLRTAKIRRKRNRGRIVRKR